MGNDGKLVFVDPAGEISPAIGARAFARTQLGQEAGMKLDGMRTRFFLDRAVIGGHAFRVEISYEGERLDRVELFLHLPGDKAGWDGWTEANERQRKEAAETWARQIFGKEMEVKPFELDGEEIVPFEVKWDTVRRAKFEWGEVLSYFDAKAGFSGVAVKYGTP